MAFPEIDALPRDVPTPALVVDRATLRRNIERMAAYASRHGLALRPHTKTHKSLALARMQLAAGAVGLTVAKAGEAEVMSAAAPEVDLLVAYPAVGAARLWAIATLARRTNLRVAVDTPRAAELLSEACAAAGATAGVLVDLDVGLHRTGVADPHAALLLARTIAALPGLRLDGLFVYPGQIGGDEAAQRPQLEAVRDLVNETISLWAGDGHPANIVSGGSTPTAMCSHIVDAYTEIRPGTYVFNDMNCVRGGYADLEDCAARIVATVVSDAVPGQVVIDAGSKTLTSDRCGPDPESGFGHVVELPQARVAKLTEEHGQVDVSGAPHRPAVGERVSIIPNHICPCVNLQDAWWWVAEDGTLERSAVDARGRLT